MDRSTIPAEITMPDHRETKLKHSEEMFKLLVDGVQDYAIYLLNPYGFVSTWNSGAQRIKGYAAEEIIGKHFSCFFPPEDRAHHKPQYALDTAAGEGRFEEEGLRVRKDGSMFWASVLITALYDETGTLTGFAKVVRDVTERKENERKFQEKERLATLGTTAAVFAHEIANPLNGISTSLQIAQMLLMQREWPDSDVLEMIKAAFEEVKRLGSLLQDYRSIARPQHPNWETVDLHRLVLDVLTPAMRHYGSLGVEVNIHYDEHLPNIRADKEKIKQVILNLCKNAVEAMPDGGDLSINMSAFNERVLIELSDTGIGIPDNIDVFQLFQTTKLDGTGLGLAIVQQIVSDHHGLITYVTGPQKGTTFTVSFPAFSV